MRCNVSPTDRRRFLRSGLALVGLGFVAGCGAPTLQTRTSKQVSRVGILGNFPSAAWDAFRDGLTELGYVEGETITFEYRWSDSINDRFPALAAELVRAEVDVIAASSGPGLFAAKTITNTIPLVSVGAFANPVENGFIASYSRPGGNITGLTGEHTEVAAKRLQLLIEVVPSTTRVAVLQNIPSGMLGTRMQEAGTRLGLQIQMAPLVATADDFDGTFEAISREKGEAIYVERTALFVAQRARIVAFLERLRLPSVVASPELVQEGALLYYASNGIDIFRRAAAYIDKLLRGANPAELPVEQPTEFDLVVNLGAARRLGLIVPPSVLQQATEVIQ